jgi:hypothetical protein
MDNIPLEPDEEHIADFRFGQDDVDILNVTLNLVPELRICAAAAKRARRMALNYPLRSAESVCELLGGEVFEGAGYRISRADIFRYMPSGYFPIENEAELIARAYMALLRCRQESFGDTIAAVLEVESFTVAHWPP